MKDGQTGAGTRRLECDSKFRGGNTVDPYTPLPITGTRYRPMNRIDDIQALRCGDKVTYRDKNWVPKAHTATIVAVSHDNTDDGVIPFSQITVRVHDSQENVRLSGPEIKFYLTRVT